MLTPRHDLCSVLIHKEHETEMATKTLKLFTSDGRALTDLVSYNDSILLPHEITVTHEGATAHRADQGDYEFESLEELCFEYGLDADLVKACFDGTKV
jgi:hypothetical protein